VRGAGTPTPSGWLAHGQERHHGDRRPPRLPVSPTASTRDTLLRARFVGLDFLLCWISFYAAAKIVSPEVAMLMFVALLGMYVGFGILIAVYRFIGKLE
jgi:hypothetical protein